MRGLILALLLASAPASADSLLARDKAEHVVVSGALTVAAQYLLEVKLGGDRWAVLPAAAGAALATGTAKEATDSEFSWRDLAADAVGVLGGVLVIAW